MTDVAADTATEATPDASDAPDTDTTDWKAEAEKWKTQARKHEDRAKAHQAAAKELEQVKAASMSEQERAVAQAVAEARQQTLAEVGSHLAAAEVRVAAAGRLDDDQLVTLLDSIDLPKFLNEDGSVDTDKVNALVDGIAPKAPDTPNVFEQVDLGQGSRNGNSPQHMALNGDPLLSAVRDRLGIKR
jgi:hypothetical protein